MKGFYHGVTQSLTESDRLRGGFHHHGLHGFTQINFKIVDNNCVLGVIPDYKNRTQPLNLCESVESVVKIKTL